MVLMLGHAIAAAHQRAADDEGTAAARQKSGYRRAPRRRTRIVAETGVRFGSFPDINPPSREVRFAPKLGSIRIHSITSSARPIKDSGTVMPSALAVSRLMNNSTLVACWTGKSAGFSPLRTRPV
jgi:hypothetical protein